MNSDHIWCSPQTPSNNNNSSSTMYIALVSFVSNLLRLQTSYRITLLKWAYNCRPLEDTIISVVLFTWAFIYYRFRFLIQAIKKQVFVYRIIGWNWPNKCRILLALVINMNNTNSNMNTRWWSGIWNLNGNNKNIKKMNTISLESVWGVSICFFFITMIIKGHSNDVHKGEQLLIYRWIMMMENESC